MPTLNHPTYWISLLLLAGLCTTAKAAIVVDAQGAELSGRIGAFSENGVKFYSDAYYVLELNNIRDAWPNPNASPEEKQKQQAKVDKLLKVIDRERFLIDDLHLEVKNLLLNKRFAELDKLGHRLLHNKERFPSGRWKLVDFYIGMREGLNSRDVAGHLKRIEYIEQWVEQRPQSTAAKIALMSGLKGLAWAHRGTGLGASVSEKGKTNFAYTKEQIVKIGAELRENKARDPMLYSYLIIALQGLGADPTDIRTLAEESMVMEPLFFNTYFSAMDALLPRWSGIADEAARFAKWLVEADSTPKKIEFYYRLVKYVKSTTIDKRYTALGFDWHLIEKGFNEYSKNYFTTDEDYNLMAKLACLHGQRESANKYFASTSGQWNHFAAAIWQQNSIREQFKIWAAEKPDPIFTKIERAVLNTDLPLVKELFDSYRHLLGDVKQTDIYGNTLMHILVERGHVDYVKSALQANMELNSYNSFGLTPLHISAKYKRHVITKLLLEHGADPYAETHNAGYTALHLAAKNGYEETVSELLKHEPGLLNKRDKYAFTGLHHAANEGHIETAKTLATFKKLEIDLRTYQGDTALHLAAKQGHLAVVKLLIRAGADPNNTNIDNHTALSLAKYQGFQSLINYLESINAKDSNNFITAERKEKARALYKQAVKQSTPENYKETIAQLKTALEYNSNSFGIYHTLGLMVWQFEKDNKQADTYLRKSMELNPSHAENYYWLGRVNHSMGRPEIYKPLFQQYVEMAPDTYNAQDLKRNYSGFLSDGSSATDSKVSQSAHFVSTRYWLIIGLLGLILLLLLLRRRGKTV